MKATFEELLSTVRPPRGPGPYRARPAQENSDVWYVCGADGRRNLLSYAVGAVLCSREFAEAVAAMWNDREGKGDKMIDRLDERQAIAKQIADYDQALVAARKLTEDTRAALEQLVAERSDVASYGLRNVFTCQLTGLPLFWGDRVYCVGGYILAAAITTAVPADTEPFVLTNDDDDEESPE